MKVSSKYSALELITYEFSEQEIREALIKYYNINVGNNRTKVEFELGWKDYDNDKTYPTILTVRFETDVKQGPIITKDK